MKQKIGRKLLGFLLTLAMIVGFIPGMNLTVIAETEKSETIDNVGLNDENALKEKRQHDPTRQQANGKICPKLNIAKKL